ncbi:UNVERIFIED_CONTAM: GTP-binding protein [Hammondia hammondi]|eukprot:XP_008883009.1 GTP-binding protein [Hammondia hammondi]
MARRWSCERLCFHGLLPASKKRSFSYVPVSPCLHSPSLFLSSYFSSLHRPISRSSHGARRSEATEPAGEQSDAHAPPENSFLSLLLRSKRTHTRVTATAIDSAAPATPAQFVEHALDSFSFLWKPGNVEYVSAACGGSWKEPECVSSRSSCPSSVSSLPHKGRALFPSSSSCSVRCRGRKFAFSSSRVKHSLQGRTASSRVLCRSSGCGCRRLSSSLFRRLPENTPSTFSSFSSSGLSAETLASPLRCERDVSPLSPFSPSLPSSPASSGAACFPSTSCCFSSLSSSPCAFSASPCSNVADIRLSLRSPVCGFPLSSLYSDSPACNSSAPPLFPRRRLSVSSRLARIVCELESARQQGRCQAEETPESVGFERRQEERADHQTALANSEREEDEREEDEEQRETNDSQEGEKHQEDDRDHVRLMRQKSFFGRRGRHARRRLPLQNRLEGHKSVSTFLPCSEASDASTSSLASSFAALVPRSSSSDSPESSLSSSPVSSSSLSSSSALSSGGTASTRVASTTTEKLRWDVMKSLTEEDVENFPRYEKPFVDFLWCEAKAGNGGKPKKNAVRSRNFRGPGYGGHGGNVILEADQRCGDLLQVEQTLQADNGGDAEGTSRGLHAKDRIVKVPLGTIVRKRVATGRLSSEGRRYKQSLFWFQFLFDKQSLAVAAGGRGGLAPSSFKKKDGRLPEPGERNCLELELRLVNDVALIGAPNSGKTSFAAAVTRYQSKIGSESMQTRRPHIGTLRYVDGVEFKLMDLPAVCPGAHQDKSRGMRILRHLYRSRLLVYVVDVARGASLHPVHLGKTATTTEERLLLTEDQPLSGAEGPACGGVTGQGDPFEDFLYLREEVMKHRKDNEGKKELVIATKCDALHRGSLYHLDSLYHRLRNQFPEIPIVGVSARFGLGLQEAVSTIRQLLGPEDWLVKERRVQMEKSWQEFLLPNRAEEDKALRRLDFFPLPPVNLPANVGASLHPPPPLTMKIVGSHGFSHSHENSPVKQSNPLTAETSAPRLEGECCSAFPHSSSREASGTVALSDYGIMQPSTMAYLSNTPYGTETHTAPDMRTLR